MVARETTFLVGGALTVSLGGLLAAGLLWAGAGWEFFGSYLSALLLVGFGAFCVAVGRAEGRERRDRLRRLEDGDAVPPGEGRAEAGQIR